ncbi:hypothetical protein RFI_01812 [Reticulomyxa filosa]|uniref:Uncharacterized protein n=1 Tax=Reticulomyxa filosa TaxID=46433 RepID=X6P9M4_RETFI|nr:hypothetical protein RFI_01812 [Reticulomyxa filosa]|eukprot:ETO35250.1 hypothetical protein RFI_01812 [Reticulomyxa filosa]
MKRNQFLCIFLLLAISLLTLLIAKDNNGLVISTPVTTPEETLDTSSNDQVELIEVGSHAEVSPLFCYTSTFSPIFLIFLFQPSAKDPANNKYKQNTKKMNIINPALAQALKDIENNPNLLESSQNVVDFTVKKKSESKLKVKHFNYVSNPSVPRHLLLSKKQKQKNIGISEDRLKEIREVFDWLDVK